MYSLAKVNYIGFSPNDNMEDILSEAFEQAAESISIMIFKINSIKLINKLNNAYKNGVKVRIIVDYKNLKTDKKAIDIIQKAGIPFKIYKGVNSEILHHKVTLIDSSTVILGTGNYVSNDFKCNHESLLSIDCKDLSNNLKDVFDTIWISKRTVSVELYFKLVFYLEQIVEKIKKPIKLFKSYKLRLGLLLFSLIANLFVYLYFF